MRIPPADVGREVWAWAKENKLGAVQSVTVLVFVPLALYRVVTEAGLLPAALLSLGIAVAWLAVLYPQQLAARFAESWPFFSMMSGGLALALVTQFTDRTGSDGFYETSAQVVPVLLLTLAIEVRLLPQRLTGDSLRTALLIVYLLVGAEFCALQSIERGEGGPRQFELTIAGLVAGFVAVSLIALSATVRQNEEAGPGERAGDETGS